MITYWVGIFIALYIAALLFAYYTQDRFMFYPSKERWSETGTYDTGGWELVKTKTQDGLQLQHLFLRSGEKNAPVIFYIHGNAGHIAHRLEKYEFYKKAGYSVFLLEYRGFGLNPGIITESGLYEDAASAMAWLDTQEIPRSRVFVHGESLGTAIAVDLAAKASKEDKAFAGVILEAPFASMPDMAQHRFWYFPARWLVRFRFDSAGKIKSLVSPVLVIHGKKDSAIPYAQGKKVFDAAKEPKHMLSVEGGGHDNLMEFDNVRSGILEFISDVSQKSPVKKHIPNLSIAK